MNNGLAQRLNLGHEEEVDSPRGKRFCKVIVFFLISRYACAELVDKGRRLGRRNTLSLSTKQLYARSKPLRSKFFCHTSFMGGSINSEIHGIQFWCAICMVLKASFSLRTWAAAQQFKQTWLHSPCTMFDNKISHIARYALSFSIKKTLPIPYKSHHQNL